MLALVVVLLAAAPTRAAAGAQADGAPTCQAPRCEDRFDVTVRGALRFSRQQLKLTSKAIPRIRPRSFPNYTGSDGSWKPEYAGAWISGFFPGSLWLKYQQTADADWLGMATRRQAPIESQKRTTTTHDLGFMVFNSFGNGYRLTGNRAYRDVALTAAGSLATRYREEVGAIRSLGNGPSGFLVIIDNMVNLELLFWGARSGGEPAWHDMAVEHALTTMRSHVRPDGSTYHVAFFDPATGEITHQGTSQGAAHESTWSRGQAWAIYGYTVAYRETGDARFLDTARRTADWFVDRLPTDHVPYWDFDRATAGEPRDTSAAAVAASALLELSTLDPDEARQGRYAQAAKAMVASLSSRTYLAKGTSSHAILQKGTYHRPGGHYGTGLVWGDYYFLEALMRLRWLVPTTPKHPITAVRASAHDGNRGFNAVDGNPATRWSAAGDGQWLRLDLGRRRTVRKVAVAFHQGDRRAARFSVQTSLDGRRWTTATTAMSSGMTNRPEAYDFADRHARFVRVVGYGNTENRWNSVTEVAIY